MSRIDRRRDATRVIYEILSIGAMGASKSNIIFKVNLDCDPWIPEDAPADDLLNLTERIKELAVELQH